MTSCKSVITTSAFLRTLNYSSLNLAMAVQILAYEVRVAHLDLLEAACRR
jgi:tRNA C32,U32 (ribose-2'-O)-methylase TrmJ